MDEPIDAAYVVSGPPDDDVVDALGRRVAVHATDPRNAPAYLEAESIDCVIVGAVEDPEAVVRTVRNRFGSLPIVVLADGERSAATALAAGATDVASPDEPPGLLRARIEDAVETFRTESPADGRRDRRFADSMLDALDDLVYAFDGEGFVHWNDRLAEVTGHADGELARRHPVDLFEGSEADRIAAAIDACDVDALPVTLEAELEMNDGRSVPYEFTNTLLRDGDTVVGVVGVGRDVTERRRTERTLERLLEATHELMDAEDERAVAQAAVAAAGRVLGLDRTGIHLVDSTGERLEPVALTDAAEASIGAVPTLERGESLAWEVFEAGTDRVYEDVHRQTEVHNPETHLRSEMIFSLGEHGVMIVASTDIDEFDDADVYFAKLLSATITTALERARREAALEYKNAQLEEFVGVVSHDLRNPLGVAEGYVELAMETDDRSHLERVQRSHDRMRRIIDDLLLLAREGRAVGTTEPVDLGSVARRAWRNVESPEATLRIDDDRTIVADESRLMQLFENAFRNAIEHAGPDVAVTVEAFEGGFAIADDGPGIDPEERETVFEPGYTDADEGTGFGMTIIESVAEGHGWRCTIEESDSGGLRLVVRMDGAEEQGPNAR